MKPLFIEITEDGKVQGIEDNPNQRERTELILVPVGLRQVAIMHEKTKRYIAMDSDGNIYSTVRLLYQLIDYMLSTIIV